MRRVLAVLCGITAVLMVANVLYSAADPDTALMIWNFVVDPAVLLFLGIAIVIHVRDSLQVRNEAGPHPAQLPRDVVTALEAVVLVRFLLQYVYSLSPNLEPTPNLWEHLDALLIVILAFEAIALWRSAERTP